jgi:hypothetical protein
MLANFIYYKIDRNPSFHQACYIVWKSNKRCIKNEQVRKAALCRELEIKALVSWFAFSRRISLLVRNSGQE